MPDVVFSTPKDLVVGYESHNYGGERNTYAPANGVSYVKMRRIPFEYTPGREHLGLHRVFAPIGPNRDVSLIHLWNRVSVGRLPWGVSFEDTVPYLNPRIHPRAIALQRRRLFSAQCRFIIGMSDHAVSRFRSTLSDAEWAEIDDKVHRVYPHHPKPTRRSPYSELSDTDPLRLIFVGGDFFRKGGEAILRSVEQLGDELNLQLTVISGAEGNDYAGTPPSEVNVESIQRRLDENLRIDWRRKVSHNEVMTTLETHHLGLLPTFSDTFGYSVLEFMSLGVPSIVSNVQALPEFTGAETGWIVDLPIDRHGIWLGRNPDIEQRRTHYFESVDRAASQLGEILHSIRSKPELLQLKSASALIRFDTQFDPVRRADRMKNIYKEALA